MKKQANLSRVMYISVMLVASSLRFVLAAKILAARDAAVLKAVSQAWRIDWNWRDPCSNPWLECDNIGNAISLDLRNTVLTGSIPESLGDLNYLTRLALIETNLTGNIPESLGNLTNLEYLYLTNNSLSGNIPATLGRLQGLYQLDLSTNELTGSIPKSLGNLTNLQHLQLSYNKLTGSIPESLGNLINLQGLWLIGNRLTGRIPESLGDLKNLKYLICYLNNLSGSIPESLGNSIDLQHLSLSGNNLTGRIPESLGNLANLQGLSLRGNNLTGRIPESLGNLANLQRLSLGENELTGSIPEYLGSLIRLEEVYLDSNNLTGNIPVSLGGLQNLSTLNLSRNELTGSISESLGNLTNLKYLDLSNNKLTGNIPQNLGDLYIVETGSFFEGLRRLHSLDYLDLSNNKLTGNIPQHLGDLFTVLLQDNFFTSVAPGFTYKSPVGQNPYNNISGNCIANSPGQRSDADCQIYAASTIIAALPGSDQLPTIRRILSSVSWWIWLAISVVFVFILLAATDCFLVKRRSNQDPTMNLGIAGISTLTTYTLAEIRSMTRNWRQENLLGSGGFGSVYKGVAEGQFVAVKRLKMERVNDINKAMKEFLNEVAILSKVRHRNLVDLKGFCCDRGERILVMEFVSNGNLADHLFYRQEKGLPVLEWSTRCRIATTAADALHYLHSLNDEKIIHRDIKAENILLDKSYNSLVCDFGLAKLTSQMVTGTMPTVATRNIAGTRGYMAPEWIIQGILSDKMDVYSFGIVLLELVTGVNRFNCFSLGDGPGALYSVHEAARIVCTARQDALSLLLDPNITQTAPPESVLAILRLALHCTNEERRDRPTMERVVRMLKGMIEVPPLPTGPPSWLQQAGNNMDLGYCKMLQDWDAGETTSQELCIYENRESTQGPWNVDLGYVKRR